MGVPQGLTLEVPGAGPLTTRRVAALPGEGLQVALSNVVGAWAEHYGVTDLEHLAILVDRNDGLQVELPEAVTLGERRARARERPDDRRTGGRVPAARRTRTRSRAGRSCSPGSWPSPPQLEPDDLTETDDVAGVQATLNGAEGGHIETLPVQVAAATIRVPKYSELDELMAERFGVKRTPVPVIVQNAARDRGGGRGGRPADHRPRVPHHAVAERRDVRPGRDADRGAGGGATCATRGACMRRWGWAASPCPR